MEVVQPASSSRARRRRLLRHNRLATLGAIIVCVVVLIGVFAPLVAPYDPILQDTPHRLEPPSAAHLLGSDQFGRDILSRLAFGSRTTLLVAVSAVAVGLLVGGGLGLVSGFVGGQVERVIVMLIDVLLSFPLLLLAILVAFILGPGVVNVAIAVGISQVPTFARLARALTLSVRERDYVAAASAVGARPDRVMLRHVLPNIAGPLGAQATSTVALAILSATSLNFLGIGVQPPTPDWGAMVADAKRYIFDRPELALYPGVAILVTVLGLNLAGDGLLDVLGQRDRRAA
ncbi:MAG: ABC transporter permease [Chloroflexota bacterium]|nr:ABC transporter permease [Chloroflexota bacterium]